MFHRGEEQEIRELTDPGSVRISPCDRGVCALMLEDLLLEAGGESREWQLRHQADKK